MRSQEALPARREDSLDFMRGLVMVVMALDHTRDFFTNVTFDAEELTQTSSALFATRWITHFCAPIFFFLAGTGAFLYGEQHGSAATGRFLLSRGLWLIFLEFSVVGTAWTLEFPWGVFGVIWALGASMIALSVIVKMKVPWIAVFSVAVIASHDLFDTLRPEPGSSVAVVWHLLHVKGDIHLLGRSVFVLFPLVPWFAVMSAGYAFGALRQRSDRKVWMLRAGFVMIAAFVVLRVTNWYGNPPALNLGHGLGRPIVMFGRVPLFFYILHLYLIHALAIVLAILVHQPYQWLLHGAFWLNDLPRGYGYGLPIVYLVWFAAIAMLYVPCAWFAGIKQRRNSWWLRYL